MGLIYSITSNQLHSYWEHHSGLPKPLHTPTSAADFTPSSGAAAVHSACAVAAVYDELIIKSCSVCDIFNGHTRPEKNMH